MPFLEVISRLNVCYRDEPIAGRRGKSRIVFNKNETAALRAYSKDKNIPLIPESTSDQTTFQGRVFGIYNAGMVERGDELLELQLDTDTLIFAKQRLSLRARDFGLVEE